MEESELEAILGPPRAFAVEDYEEKLIVREEYSANFPTTPGQKINGVERYDNYLIVFSIDYRTSRVCGKQLIRLRTNYWKLVAKQFK